MCLKRNTSLAAPGALAHRLQRRTDCNAEPPAMLYRLQSPKSQQGAPKLATRFWKGVYQYVFGRSLQLLLNKFPDPSPPSMRKEDDREKKKKKKKKREIMLLRVATNVVASRPPERQLTGILTIRANTKLPKIWEGGDQIVHNSNWKRF